LSPLCFIAHKCLCKIFFCNLGNTIIGHGDSLGSVVVPMCEGKNCFSKTPKYDTVPSQLQALIDLSTSCHQEIKVTLLSFTRT
jgi:hypothetical protein